MKRLLIFLILPFLALNVCAQKRKVQNRPYADQRIWHYGFLVGAHTQDMEFVNNGFVTPEGESWFADVAEYSPGFSVGVLGELYLHKYIAARLIPTLHFGDKTVVFKEQNSGKRETQNMKTAFLSLPVDFKFSAERFNNYRPSFIVGVSPSFDLNRKKGKALRVKPFNCYAEIGFSCDIYLRFFKLIPELKFGFGLLNVLETKRDDLRDKSLMKFTQSVDAIHSKTISLTFYFE